MQVSHEEWVSMWNDYAKNPDNALDWQNRYMNFMFELEDSSGKAEQGRSIGWDTMHKCRMVTIWPTVCVACNLILRTQTTVFLQSKVQ